MGDYLVKGLLEISEGLPKNSLIVESPLFGAAGRSITPNAPAQAKEYTVGFFKNLDWATGRLIDHENPLTDRTFAWAGRLAAIELQATHSGERLPGARPLQI